MIVVMDGQADESAVEAVIEYLARVGCDVHRSSGETRTVLGVVGATTEDDLHVIADMRGVTQAVRVSEPFNRSSRRFRREATVVSGEWGNIGGPQPWIAIEAVDMADPSSAPDSMAPPQAPRPSQLPYEMASGRPFDAAVTRARRAPDSLGSLACLSLHPQPTEPKWPVVFVTRAAGWSLEDWLVAADRELQRTGSQVVLLEKGEQTSGGPRTLDVCALVRAKRTTHLPIVVDVPAVVPRTSDCPAVSTAAIGAGADGVILRLASSNGASPPRVAGTLPWDDAVAVAKDLRQMAEARRR